MDNKNQLKNVIESRNPDYQGETLEELRVKRAEVAIRLEIRKDILQKKLHDTFSSSPSSVGWGLFLGNNSGKNSIVRYIPIAIKSMKFIYRIWTVFGKRKR